MLIMQLSIHHYFNSFCCRLTIILFDLRFFCDKGLVTLSQSSETPPRILHQDHQQTYITFYYNINVNHNQVGYDRRTALYVVNE